MPGKPARASAIPEKSRRTIALADFFRLRDLLHLAFYPQFSSPRRQSDHTKRRSRNAISRSPARHAPAPMAAKGHKNRVLHTYLTRTFDTQALACVAALPALFQALDILYKATDIFLHHLR